MKKSELTPQEKICIIGTMLLGKEYLPVAYALSHPNAKTKSETSLTVMRSRWWASPLSLSFRQEMQDKIARIAVVKGNDLTTKEGIISQLVTATQETSGKDSVSALQTLAKLQGFDKPDKDENETEHRKYILPYRTKCRFCKLMELYVKILNEQS
ncbi:MAG: hypothetical protein IKZ62_03380 [Prevotella sp.]|nr:hypothetical protein [Prevotella sp.]